MASLTILIQILLFLHAMIYMYVWGGRGAVGSE